MLEDVVGAAARFGAAQAVEPSHHFQVLATGQVLVDGGILAGQSDDGAQGLSVTDDIESGNGCAAPVGSQQGGEDTNRGGLAGAVRSKESVHGSLFDAQIDARQRVHIPKRLVKVFNFDDGHVGSLGKTS